MSNCRQVVAVEKDERFVPALKLLQESVGAERLKIVMGDILELDEAQLLRDVEAEVTDWEAEGKGEGTKTDILFSIYFFFSC
jgi:16S rRNA A1518/A1519 N6-dimethyltransferase RsmA/KsgA/DIM1 with predicted DNA glycosylase/AP lyase activity